MTQLILVCHCQTDWDKEKRIQGSLDIPLNDVGKREAQEISGKLSKFKISAIYSSPAVCSFSTASEIAAPHKLKVKKTDSLSELNQGLWQGLQLSDVKKRYKKQYNAWKTSPASGQPPGGESGKAAYDRAVCAAHKIINNYKDEAVCVVSGNIILSMIKCHFKEIDIKEMWSAIPKKTWWEVLELE